MSEQRAATPRIGARLSNARLGAFAFPSMAVGATFMMASLFLVQFSTEVLGVAPALVGIFLLLARLWDGVSDPLAGYLSDRTRSRLGRRRIWLLASALPISASLLMLWSPPLALEGRALDAWVGVSLLALYTALTIFLVPYQALAAEQSDDHHERSRVFGAVQGAQLIGILVAAGLGSYAVTFAEDTRSAMASVAAGLAVVSLLSILGVVALAHERPERQGRGSHDLFGSFRDVLRNPHARVAYAAFAIDTLGGAALAGAAPFYTKYVIEAERFLVVFLACYSLPGLLMVPVWVRLSRRFGKAPLWRIGLAIQAVGFAGLGFIGSGDLYLASALVGLMSIGGTCGQVLSPSLLADVVDYDELQTGQRKEGAYFATFNFVRKVAFGIGGAVLGFTLQATGFEKDVVPGAATVHGLRMLSGFLPMLGALLAVVVLSRYRLGFEEHARVRSALDARVEPAGTA